MHSVSSEYFYIVFPGQMSNTEPPGHDLVISIVTDSVIQEKKLLKAMMSQVQELFRELI